MRNYRKLSYLLLVLAVCNCLSGCIALAAGGAGGYYFAKHYDVKKKGHSD